MNHRSFSVQISNCLEMENVHSSFISSRSCRRGDRMEPNVRKLLNDQHFALDIVATDAVFVRIVFFKPSGEYDLALLCAAASWAIFGDDILISRRNAMNVLTTQTASEINNGALTTHTQTQQTEWK